MQQLRLISENELMPVPFLQNAKIRAIKMTAPTLTREIIIESFPLKKIRPGLCIMSVVGRHSNAKRFVGFVDGFGLERGALAHSISFDESAICSIGADPKSVISANNRVIELGGGIVVADGEEIIAELPLPIAGVQSDRPYEAVAAFLARLPCVLHSRGCKWRDPLYSVRTLTFTGLPDLRITTEGYFDVLKGIPLPLTA